MSAGNPELGRMARDVQRRTKKGSSLKDARDAYENSLRGRSEVARRSARTRGPNDDWVTKSTYQLAEDAERKRNLLRGGKPFGKR